MSFPILRDNLNNVSSAVEYISTLNNTNNNISSFIERRVHDLSKDVLNQSVNGNNNIDIQIIMATNYEPILEGLQKNFPDCKFISDVSTNKIYIDWSKQE
jgi:hypothetical protein